MDEIEKKNTRFLVSKRGKPKIIMLSVTDYLKHILKEDELLTEVCYDFSIKPKNTVSI
ncbi:MAG: hypothetical protein MUO31_03160 [Thermodesulfovibrionales bacterium]|nr:hypothetical protein [Thermodesulfovibrionales bacterium]